jgi:hypothetical protein
VEPRSHVNKRGNLLKAIIERKLNDKKMENQSPNSFPVPLIAGWAVNIVGWILFVSTSNHTLEIITGLLCIGCVYVGYKHKELNTEPALGKKNLSPANLIYASGFEAVWMLLWGFGLFGDF